MTPDSGELLRRDIDALERDVRSMDPNEPGLALRVDRLERRMNALMSVISWIGGGGILGLAGTIYLLVQIAQKLNADMIP